MSGSPGKNACDGHEDIFEGRNLDEMQVYFFEYRISVLLSGFGFSFMIVSVVWI